MSYTDKLIEDFNSNSENDEIVNSSEKPAEWSTEAPKEWAKPEDKPEQSEEPKAAEVTEVPPTENPTETTQPTEQPEPKKEFTKEERAEHAFRRQLSKQKEKHQAEIEELKKSFQSQLDDFKKSFQAKEPIKTRGDFESDDAYISYLAQNAVNGVMSERDAKAAEEAAEAEKLRKEQEARQAEDEQLMRSFGENSHRAFSGEAFTEYSKQVNRALDNGLGEVLDEVPTLRDYIFKNPEGPIVLQKMLASRDNFTKVMMQTDPTMMLIAAHELAREPAPVATAQPVVASAPTVPHIGKPGARNASSEAGSMFGSDKSLMAYVRNCNSRRR